jgi:hypothetical protein
MKPRTTIVLLVLTLVIGGFVYWDYKKGVSTDEAAEKAKRLVDLKAADVSRVELVRSNQTVLVEKSKEQWQIQQPLAFRADNSAVSAILDAIEFAQRERTFKETEITATSLADFGLTSPRLRLVMKAKQGDFEVSFGSETPTKESVYVLVKGQKTPCLVRKNVYERADASLDSLRNRTVIDVIASAATRIEVKNADRLLELAKAAATTNAEPRWSVVKPFQVRADQQKVGDLLNGLSSLRVQEFVSDDPKEAHTYQLGEPQAEVTVWTGDKGQTLLIGRSPTNDTTKVYAKLKSADAIFTIPANEAKKYELQVNDVRDTRVLTFAEGDVRLVEIQSAVGQISLARTGSLWNVVAPVSLPADNASVEDLLHRLSELTATQFVADVATDLAKYGLSSPAVTVTLRGEGTNVLSQLLVGSTDTTNNFCHVKRGDEPYIHGVEPNLKDNFPVAKLAWRTRRISELKPEQITKLTVERAGDRVALEQGADKKWKMIQPSQGVLDNNRLEQLLDLLSFLHADELVQEGLDKPAAYGFDKPTAKFTMEAAGKSYVLQLGKEKAAGATFASWSDPSLVFTLGTPSVQGLSGSLVTSSSTNAPTAK